MYHVLIADGDPLMREALALMIDRLSNFEKPYSVGSGEKALEICRQKQVDIVFMELLLPGLLGLEAASHIISESPGTVVYLLTSYHSLALTQEAMKLNIRQYLPKPVSEETIRTILLGHNPDPAMMVNKQLEALLEIVRERDLKRAYYELTPVAASIRALSAGKPEQLREILNQLGRGLIDSLDAFDPERTALADLPPFNPTLLSSEQRLELWLFKALEYVLWQAGLHRYPFLEKVSLFIETHIKENISLNDIVNNCAVSQAHLSRIFRRQFGVTVMEYLHFKKLNLAKSYFTFTDHSASEVASKLGFNEITYFSKVFKKYEHGTVSEFKKQLISGNKNGDGSAASPIDLAKQEPLD
ncbi:MAG: response regulator [Deltaproteobacteria bacterium]|jgi:two-component system response regulator YesN|nr:response regulator [Deltaproteobacteria bacterium]